MSNEVYGIIQMKSAPVQKTRLFKKSIKDFGISIHEIDHTELYNFPERHAGLSKNELAFAITDRAGSRNATYLIDYIDYVEGAEIGLPLKGKERLNILINLINSLFNSFSIEQLLIAITDSSQIEEVKEIDLSNMKDVFYDDFEEMAPPCILYSIKE